MTSPIPGVGGSVSPRTWAAGDQITTPRLRAATYNAAGMMLGRPAFLTTWQPANTFAGTVTTLLTNMTGIGNPIGQQTMNTWNSPLSPPGTITTTYWTVPMAGWYLIQGQISMAPVGGTPGNNRYTWGFITVVNGTNVFTDAASMPWVPTGSYSSFVGGCGAHLALLSPTTGDKIGLYASTNNTQAEADFANLMVEWVALPGTAPPSYTGALGTVVSSPKPAQLWPPGNGTTLTAPGTAGATSLTVASASGMRAGQTIGLDWQFSRQSSAVAEQVTVNSIAGSVVTVSATTYPHSSGAPVAVPVSAAFLNEQVRDTSNFLMYPPTLYAVGSNSQLIASTTFPTSAVVAMTAQFDNFSGFASNAYTVPVSGVYLVTGTIFYNSSGNAQNYATGLNIGGTVFWGELTAGHPLANTGIGTSVIRLFRITAGTTISLQAFQNNTGATSISTLNTTSAFSRLNVLFRSF